MNRAYLKVVSLFIQPIPGGDLRNVLNEQEGLYTLIARGREDGKEVAAKRLITLRKQMYQPIC